MLFIQTNSFGEFLLNLICSSHINYKKLEANPALAGLVQRWLGNRSRFCPFINNKHASSAFSVLDGTPVPSTQNLDALHDRRPLPPVVCHRLVFVFHLPSSCLKPSVLPRPVSNARRFSRRPPGGLLQRSGQRGLHREGHQQRPARVSRLSRTVSAASPVQVSLKRSDWTKPVQIELRSH